MEYQRPLGIILAGGKSQRLYPVQKPKPLLKKDGKFLLQDAIERLDGFDIRIVTNASIAVEIKSTFLAAGLETPKFIIEPEGRDTAAAVGFALKESQSDSHPWVAVLSADHWMPESKKFSSFLKDVEAAVKKNPDSLFVAGSPRTSKNPKTHFQFGWIAPRPKTKATEKNDPSLAVESFVEKPSLAKLRNLYKKKALINCGMFFGNFKTFLKAYQKLYPQVLGSETPYSKLVRTPIDRAIFEKFESVRVIPFPLRWEDLGTWEDWYDHSSPRQKGVYISSNSLNEISVFGLQDIAVVEDSGRLLVMPLSKTRNLKDYLTGKQK